VWGFKIGGAVPPRPAPAPPETVRTWTGRIEDTANLQLGAVRTFNIASANKTIEWLNEYAVGPSRVKVKAGAAVTFKNTSTISHTIQARDGSWRTGPIRAGADGSVTITKAGTHEYTCTDHPWTIGQLIVE
jgi:plastocyanin